MAKIALLTIGSEILDGRTLNTNSQYLGREIKALGLKVNHSLSCADDLNDIKAAIDYLFQSGNQVILCSGGLGPTSDDLTREAISEYFSKELILNEEILSKLEERYTNINKVFPKSNRKQALFPDNSTIIPNDWGTACGFIAGDEQRKILTFPGVPAELKPMFQATAKEFLSEFSGTEDNQYAFINMFGITESALQDLVDGLDLPLSVEIIYQTNFPTNRIVLRSANPADLSSAESLIINSIDPKNIFSREEETLPELIHKLLINKEQTIATAESCTGGLVSSLLTSQAGSSLYFIGGIVCYSNYSKTKHLQVAPQNIEKFGAVSSETAKELAFGVKREFSADYGISITGIAGPDGGSEDKPVGTVFFGLSSNNRTETFQIHVPYKGREKIQKYSAFYILNQLRIRLEKSK